MLPTINGKPIFNCNEEDLQLIIDNPDYRENEYVDYKRTFSILDYPKGKDKEKQSAIAEFRSDVCSFANAGGGYLIFGVEEDGHGVPKRIEGVSIVDDNLDQLELSIKNWLHPIQPRMPNYELHNIHLSSGNDVLILYVNHDYYAPYLFIEDEKNFRIYKRYNNSKVTVSYMELRNMFRQSTVLENEIMAFRKERVAFFNEVANSQTGSDQYLLIHIIPDTFLENNYDNNVFVLYKKEKRFQELFRSFSCYESPIPMVEGLRFFHYQKESEGRLYNNGIAEVYHPLGPHLHKMSSRVEKYYPWRHYWDIIEQLVRNYIMELTGILKAERLFVCITIVGCKDVCTKTNDFQEPVGTIDRSQLLCTPSVLTDITDSSAVEHDIKVLELNYIQSLGISYGPEIKELLKVII